MIRLEPFTSSDFSTLISWIDNEELLVTIAGTVFTYPLTDDQLQTYLDKEKSFAFNVVNADDDTVIGHAELVEAGEGLWKIDKLLIGDRANRGKGIGLEAVKKLLQHAFATLNAETVELNVFDWNIAGIQCYRRAGFTMNPVKSALFEINGKKWTALNMTISKMR